ncbi:MAG: 2'-5' RNA ligase family protein [Planctomycetes bacterium]|nr:2'-5' RNA ligase family protein [Planctomycetota bacterium]
MDKKSMVEKTCRTAVVLIPPVSCHPPIQAIRKQYDRHIHRWMPHITLLYPFLPRARFDQGEIALQKALKQAAPFSVLLSDFHFFHHGRGRYTIWLVPEPDTVLKELQSEIEKVFPACNEVSSYTTGFTPHMSVGQVHGKISLEKTLQTLQAKWKPLRFQADRVQIIRREGRSDDVFRIDREIRF